MATYGFIGSQGYGKSLAINEIGLYFANRYNRSVAANFPFNVNALWEYLVYRKYWNLCKALQEGRFFYFPPDQLVGLLSVRNSEIFLDEAAHQIGSRHHHQNNDNLITKLSQVRKKKSDLLYAAQDWKSVDPELRRQTHYVINCEGALIPDLEGYPKLVAKDVSWHLAKKYEHWYNSANRDKFIFRKKHQEKRWTKPVNCGDLLLFELYDSTLDLAEDIEDHLPSEYKKIYFEKTLNPELENYLFSELNKSYHKCYRIKSAPPSYFKLTETGCSIPKKLEFYWKHLVKFPAPLFPVIRKLPNIIHSKKVLNLSGWSDWSGKYAKIF